MSFKSLISDPGLLDTNYLNNLVSNAYLKPENKSSPAYRKYHEALASNRTDIMRIELVNLPHILKINYGLSSYTKIELDQILR